MTTKDSTLAEAFVWNAVFLVRGSALATGLLALVRTPLRSIATRYPDISDAWQFVLAIVAMHEFLFVLNWILIYHDWLPQGTSSLLKYKIPRKPHQVPPKQLVFSSAVRMVASHFTFQPVALYFLFHYFGFAPLSGDVPDLVTAFRHLAVCQFVECLTFFLSHSALHTPALYRSIHKKHHEFVGPVGTTAEHAHPIELLLGNYVPVLLGPILVQAHSTTLLVWLAWRLWATYERHSGYCFKDSWLGKLGLMHGTGALYHDLHHTQNNGNYGSGLDFFDVLAGTRVY